MYEFKYRRINIPSNSSVIITHWVENIYDIRKFIDNHNHFYYCGNLLWFYELVSFEKITLEWARHQLLISDGILTDEEKELKKYLLRASGISIINIVVLIGFLLLLVIEVLFIIFILHQPASYWY